MKLRTKSNMCECCDENQLGRKSMCQRRTGHTGSVSVKQAKNIQLRYKMGLHGDSFAWRKVKQVCGVSRLYVLSLFKWFYTSGKKCSR